MYSHLSIETSVSPEQVKVLCEKFDLTYSDSLHKYLKGAGVGVSRLEAQESVAILASFAVQLKGDAASRNEIDLCLETSALSLKAYSAYKEILNGEGCKSAFKYRPASELTPEELEMARVASDLELRIFRGLANLGMLATKIGTLAQSKKVADLTGFALSI